MKGDQKIIDALNAALRALLTSADMYLLIGRLLSAWGFKDLAHGWFRDWAEYHRCAARYFIDRIVFLGGTPAMEVGTFAAPDAVDSAFKAAQTAELVLREILADAAAACDDAKDWVSQDLFVAAQKKCERRLKKIETQLELIARVGLDLYSQKRM